MGVTAAGSCPCPTAHTSAVTLASWTILVAGTRRLPHFGRRVGDNRGPGASLMITCRCSLGAENALSDPGRDYSSRLQLALPSVYSREGDPDAQSGGSDEE